MKYCRKCVQPDTRPGLVLDDDKVCSACRAVEQRQEVNWDDREKQLREIAEWAKSKSVGGFDCVVGVSGGKDSHFQSLYAKERLIYSMSVDEMKDYIRGRVQSERSSKLRELIEDKLNSLIDVDLEVT